MKGSVLLVTSDESLIATAESAGLDVQLHRAGDDLGAPVAAVVDLARADALATAHALSQRRVPLVLVARDGSAPAGVPAGAGAPLSRPVDPRALAASVQTAVERGLAGESAAVRAAWMESALASINDAVVAADATGRITFMNAAAERITGWAAADVDGRSVEEVLGFKMEGDARPGVVPSAILTRRDGGRAFVEHDAAPILDAEGGLIGVVAIFRDVSARKSLEERLGHADRMSAVGTLAAGVAHELNNPLAFASSNVQFGITELGRLTSETSGELRDELEEIRVALREAATGIARAAEIVKDVREFSRSNVQRNTLVDVNRVCSTAARLVANEIRHRAELVMELDASGAVLGDYGPLTQMLVSMLHNAIDAIPHGRTGDKVTLKCWSDDATTWISIADTGNGIAPTDLPHVFEPFFTTKPVGQGTGLSLALCHATASGLGGTIKVESTVGQGTTFTVGLPRRAARQVPLPSSNSEAARILVIDDEPLIGTAIRRILGKQGMEVVSVVSGREGVELLLSGEPFDAVFCDMMMPEFSGVDVYDALPPELRTRIIFITGNAFAQREYDVFHHTSNVRVEKPFLPADLLGAIAEVQRRHASSTS